MPMMCARCGSHVPENGRGDVTCPRCGAPQPNPAWTRPYDQAATPTLESRSSEQGSLAPGKKYALVILNGEDPGRVVSIAKPRVVMGRAECDVVLSDPQLSRQHALIAINGTSVRLEDLGSTNGTWVNGTREKRATLKNHDEIQMGKLRLRVELAASGELGTSQ